MDEKPVFSTFMINFRNDWTSMYIYFHIKVMPLMTNYGYFRMLRVTSPISAIILMNLRKIFMQLLNFYVESQILIGIGQM